jgi:catechol 2,3-dioxygenase-like lactoylglutathione lyase family enzyme
MGLGEEEVELLQFDRPGRPYPEAALASDLVVQHFAIVVSNMELAYQRLCSVSRWSAISTDGPQRLSDASAGVTSFKFRDPEGHPLELLAFAPGHSPAHWQAKSKRELCLGIDHSSIRVFDSARSIAFYAGLGLRISARSHQEGSKPRRLEGMIEPQLEVTALEPRQPTPYLQLLHHRSLGSDQKPALRDVAARRLVFEAAQLGREPAQARQAMIDPDGHHVRIVASSDSQTAWRSGAYRKAGSDPVSAKSERAG